MNEGRKARRALEDLKKLIVKSKPSVRSDYVVGFYRVWTRLPAIEKALLKKGILTQSEIDKEQIPILKKCKKDFR